MPLPPPLSFEDLSRAPTKDYDSLVPPSYFTFKRNTTASTKNSYSTQETSRSRTKSTYTSNESSSNDESSAYFDLPAYRYNGNDNQGISLSVSYDSSITTRRSIEKFEKSGTIEIIQDISESFTAEESYLLSTSRTSKEFEESKDEEYSEDESKTEEMDSDESREGDHSEGHWKAQEREEEKNEDGLKTTDEESDETKTVDEKENKSKALEEECDDQEDSDDEVIETNIKNRSLSLNWENGGGNRYSFGTFGMNTTGIDEERDLPQGISKTDIMVTVDIDDEARTSRVDELDEDDLDVEILHHRRRDSKDSALRHCHRQRREFEETVRTNIQEDLSSVYTATPKSAKLVLCVVVTTLSDGTFDHTFWSGGRVGLSEIGLKWLLFDVDDLQVYKRGRAAQKKDFGFGPLGLTESEGQHYLATSLAPRAANDVMRNVGNGIRDDLLAEI